MHSISTTWKLPNSLFRSLSLALSKACALHWAGFWCMKVHTKHLTYCVLEAKLISSLFLWDLLTECPLNKPADDKFRLSTYRSLWRSKFTVAGRFALIRVLTSVVSETSLVDHYWDLRLNSTFLPEQFNQVLSRRSIRSCCRSITNGMALFNRKYITLLFNCRILAHPFHLSKI